MAAKLTLDCCSYKSLLRLDLSSISDQQPRPAMPLQNSTEIFTPYAPVFVETGTFHGGGVSRALAEGYKKVISLEIHEPLYRENLNRFANQVEEGIVELYLGDSAHIIGEIVKDIRDPICFWFDAHDQTMNDAGVGDCKCPIVKELQSIINERAQDRRRLDVLAIDDMRLIENPSAGWGINLGDLYKSIWSYNNDFCLTRVQGHINHDILLCKNKFLR